VTQRDVVSEAKANDHGIASLAQPVVSSTGELTLFVTAPGYRAHRTAAPTTSEALTVVLEPGLVISGRVVTSDGSPVPQVQVVARPSIEVSEVSLARLGLSAAVRSRVLTDAEGRFSLDGLEAVDHAVRVLTLDWRFLRSGGATANAVRPPTDKVVLVVEPVSYVRVRLIDGETRTPLQGTVMSASGYRSTGAPVSVTLLTDQSEVSLVPAHLLDAIEGQVDTHTLMVQGLDVQSEGIDIAFYVQGYKRSWSRLRLLTSSQLLDTSSTDEIAIERENQSAVGSLEVDCARDPRPGLVRAKHRKVQLASTGDVAAPSTAGGFTMVSGQAAPTFRGRRVGEDRWLFDNLPVGTWKVRAWDGISWSRAETIRIEEGMKARFLAVWTPPTGVALRISNETGVRIVDAAVFYKGSQRIALGDNPNVVTTINLQGTAPAPAAVPAGKSPGEIGTGWLDLTPGPYDFTINRVGYLQFTKSVEVRLGEITVLDAVLHLRKGE